MTAEVINLNKARKARERAIRENEANENRLKHGQSKSERTLFQAERRKSQAELDGVKRDGRSIISDYDDDGPDEAS